MNSCSEISPSMSRSNSSIMACLRARELRQHNSLTSASAQERGRDAQLFVCEVLAEFSRDLLEVAERDLARALLVEQLERPANLVERVSSENELLGCVQEERRMAGGRRRGGKGGEGEEGEEEVGEGQLSPLASGRGGRSREEDAPMPMKPSSPIVSPPPWPSSWLRSRMSLRTSAFLRSNPSARRATLNSW